jgi:hypothetical protein
MMLMKKILFIFVALMVFSTGVNAQSLKQRALVYKYVVNDKAPGVHTTIKNGVKIWTNSNGDNLGEYEYSVTVSEKKEADKIRKEFYNQVIEKSKARSKNKKNKEYEEFEKRRSAEKKKQVEAENKKNSVESVFNVNTTD